MNEVSADEWSETKVVGKTNVGGKQKWRGGETVRKVKHSSVRIENPIPALYRGTEYFSLARTFRTALGSKNKSRQKTNEADPKGLVSFFYIGCRRVVGRLRQSSASLHPPSGTSFLREPLTRPRPATLCRSLPATTQLTSLPVFQQQVPYFEPACAWTLLYKQHTS